MIYTNLKDLENINSVLGTIICDFIEKNDLTVMETGRYDLAYGCYVNLDEYETRENFIFEAHRKYIDVQILVGGEEKILCAPISCGKEKVPFDEEKDIAFYTCRSNTYSEVSLEPGMAVVLFPEDMHAPCNWNTKRKNRKIVFKIPVSLIR